MLNTHARTTHTLIFSHSRSCARHTQKYTRSSNLKICPFCYKNIWTKKNRSADTFLDRKSRAAALWVSTLFAYARCEQLLHFIFAVNFASHVREENREGALSPPPPPLILDNFISLSWSAYAAPHIIIGDYVYIWVYIKITRQGCPPARTLSAVLLLISPLRQTRFDKNLFILLFITRERTWHINMWASLCFTN